MNIEFLLENFRNHLLLEKGLSNNTLQAYNADIKRLLIYFKDRDKELKQVSSQELEVFVKDLIELEIGARTVARNISSIKTFFYHLILSEKLETNPAENLESPKIGRSLPNALSHEEVMEIIAVIDLSKKMGERDKTIVHLLYALGLRVSELINLEINKIFFDEQVVQIEGKGSKVRFVPIGERSIRQIKYFLEKTRLHQKEVKGNEGFLFLNQRGSKLSRNYVFMFIQELVSKTKITSKVSPHTFRHSFATEMISRGADIRAVQQLLGHSSILTTEIYTHLDQSYLRDTITQFHPRS